MPLRDESAYLHRRALLRAAGRHWIWLLNSRILAMINDKTRCANGIAPVIAAAAAISVVATRQGIPGGGERLWFDRRWRQ